MASRILAALLCTLATVQCVLGGCGTYTATDGSKYNTDPLSTATDYTGQEVGPPAYQYSWNYCQNLKGLCGSVPAMSTQVLKSTGICTSIGYAPGVLSDHPSGANKGFQVSYVNNVDSKCNGGAVSRSTNLVVTCKAGADWSLVSITEPSDSTCKYIIEITSKYGCPAGHGGTVDGLSGGSLFLIIFFSVLVAYFLVGALVMWKVKGHSGVEVVPNYEFWKDLPILVKDGVLFIRYKVTGYRPV